MKTVVVYASRSGQTRLVAEEIGRALDSHGQVEMFEAEQAPARLPDADLVFIGAPTEAHSVMKPMTEYLDRMDTASVAGRQTVAFDTRIDWPRLLSGSAAEGIAKRLRSAGANVVVSPESFIVNRKPELLPGELDRVRLWATDVARVIEGRLPAAAVR
jgi:flavodoxin